MYMAGLASAYLNMVGQLQSFNIMFVSLFGLCQSLFRYDWSGLALVQCTWLD